MNKIELTAANKYFQIAIGLLCLSLLFWNANLDTLFDRSNYHLIFTIFLIYKLCEKRNWARWLLLAYTAALFAAFIKCLFCLDGADSYLWAKITVMVLRAAALLILFTPPAMVLFREKLSKVFKIGLAVALFVEIVITVLFTPPHLNYLDIRTNNTNASDIVS